MEIRNCKKCKRIFQYLDGPVLCQSCRDEDEKDFDRVKQYLKENPKASMTEVSEALEITIEKITRFLRDGRLEITPDSAIKLDCEKCGRPITSGKYCDACAGRLEGQLRNTTDELRRKAMMSQQQQSSMKFLRNDEK